MAQERVERVGLHKVHSGNQDHSERPCYRSLAKSAKVSQREDKAKNPTSVEGAAASLGPVSADGTLVVGSTGSVSSRSTTIFGSRGGASNDWLLCLGCRRGSTAGQGPFAAALAAVRSKAVTVRFTAVASDRAATSKFSIRIAGGSTEIISTSSIRARGVGVDRPAARSASGTTVRGRIAAPSV